MFGDSEFQIEFGRKLALNDDGTVLAISAPYHDDGGHLYVYGYIEDSMSWELRGPNKIHFEIEYAGLGSSLAITPDGNTIAAGANGDSLSNGRRRLRRNMQSQDSVYVNIYEAVRPD